MRKLFKLIRALSPLARTNNVRRWEKVSKEVPSWDDRNRLISGIVPPGSTVIDIGAGPQTLRKHLRNPSRYVPCDLVQATPDTIACDFNSGVFPDVMGPYDYAICSGVLEYIRNPLPFLEFVRKAGRKVVLSYNMKQPGDSIVDRMANDWINHFPIDEFRKLLGTAGFRIVSEHPSSVREIVFVLESSNQP